MTTFYLQKEKSGRLFIDAKLHDGCELVKSCEAESWKAAKATLAG